MADRDVMTKDEAWAEAERLNLRWVEEGERKRYAIAVERPDGGWIVKTTTKEPKSPISDVIFGAFFGSGGPG